MSNKKNNIGGLDDLIQNEYGKIGTEKRDDFEKGYQEFKIGAMLLNARHEKGLTQEQLAKKVGTTKSYISQIENNFKEVRISTLQKIIELGFGGKLELNVIL
jgi:HTH-type transcriptional regulator / antitoxin HipB